MNTQTLSQELTWRGFVNQTTYKSITDIDNKPINFYFGVDPSAPSMTIGNLAAAMMVRHFIRHGHKAILLVGGATGMIGDPDGKSEERSLKSLEEIERNKQGIVAQYKKIFAGLDFSVVDNYDWFKNISYLEFLRDIGKHVPMRQMLGRDFVQSRIDEHGAGISYAEFSYVLIQGYDFLHLNREYGVSLQICGSDQWGNSIAGVDLIRRITSKEAHVWSSPLVIDKSTGIKFGKSETGAVWLDAKLTSPYSFYQFWFNVDDDGVEDYLKIYTELDEQEIMTVMNTFNKNRSDREAQKTLAYEVTKLIHGDKTAVSVQRISEVLFGTSDYKKLNREDFDYLKKDLPVISLSSKDSKDIIDILVESKLTGSKSEARRFLDAGAIYLNGKQLSTNMVSLQTAEAIEGHFILRRGKNAQIVIEC